MCVCYIGMYICMHILGLHLCGANTRADVFIRIQRFVK